jgi:alpha-glucosidase
LPTTVTARQDPVFARSGGAELGRDGCRVPLPWTDDAGTSFGVSPRGQSDPWLPQPTEWGHWNAADQESDSRSMLALYRRALAVRRVTPDLTSDGFELLLPDDPDLVVYRRGQVVVVLNMSDHERPVPGALVAGLRVLAASVDDADTDTVRADSTTWFGR